MQTLNPHLKTVAKKLEFLEDCKKERMPNISISTLLVFGITINSSYGKCAEMIEMMQFCQEAAKEGVAAWVDRIDYSSHTKICSFKFVGVLDEFIEDTIFEIAVRTLSQFRYFEIIFSKNSVSPENENFELDLVLDTI